MQKEEKKILTTEQKKGEKLSLEDLELVSAGGAFSNIPRVPNNPIDDDLKGKV